MKSITPERCQAELAEMGGTDFGFAFGDMARFRVSVFKQRGSIAMVLRQIPNQMLTPEQLGSAGRLSAFGDATSWSLSCDRPYWLWKVHDTCQPD